MSTQDHSMSFIVKTEKNTKKHVKYGWCAYCMDMWYDFGELFVAFYA